MLIKLLTKEFSVVLTIAPCRMRKVVNIINAMEPEMEKLSDRELKGKPQSFVHVWKKAGMLENLIPEAFAVVREANVARLWYASLRRSVTRRYGS